MSVAELPCPLSVSAGLLRSMVFCGLSPPHRRAPHDSICHNAKG